MLHDVSLILFLMSLGPMSDVDFKKCPCRRVEFRGRGPLLCTHSQSIQSYVTISVMSLPYLLCDGLRSLSVFPTLKIVDLTMCAFC